MSLDAVIAKMEARAAEHRRYAGVPCQCESLWHADEIEGWIDELRSSASPPDGQGWQPIIGEGHVLPDACPTCGARWSCNHPVPSQEPSQEPKG